MKPPSRRTKSVAAKAFRHTRKIHRDESAEDYSELIADLIDSAGEARITEVAKHLGITHVTAIRTVKRLEAAGYVETTPHKPIRLTKKGRAVAEECRHRHRLILDLLEKLGVPKDAAEVDAEGIEHHVSQVTLRCIERFLSRR